MWMENWKGGNKNKNGRYNGRPGRRIEEISSSPPIRELSCSVVQADRQIAASDMCWESSRRWANDRRGESDRWLPSGKWARRAFPMVCIKTAWTWIVGSLIKENSIHTSCSRLEEKCHSDLTVCVWFSQMKTFYISKTMGVASSQYCTGKEKKKQLLSSSNTCQQFSGLKWGKGNM